MRDKAININIIAINKVYSKTESVTFPNPALRIAKPLWAIVRNTHKIRKWSRTHYKKRTNKK